jgi:hypothetical protein
MTMLSNLKVHIKIVICICWYTFIAALPASRALAQFSISPGEYVTVKSGGSLMIGTNVHIKSVAGSSGALADQNVNGDITITGDVTVDRYMSANEWHNVASPVSNETSACFTGTDLIFWYNESQIWNDWNFGWTWYSGATGGPLMAFRGYDVYFQTAPVTVNYHATGTATLNTGPFTYAVTLSDPTPNPAEIPSHKGWNLAGNPYPSPVDWLAASGWDKSDINDAKYIWDGINDVYTIFIGGGSPYGLNGGTRFIPSNQGFWVQAVLNGTIGINNAVRIGSMTATPDFYKLAPVDYPVVCLVADGNGKRDEVALRFIQGTTSGFDVNYDATKLYSFIEDVPQLSLQSGEQVFALNTLPEITDDLAVRLNFQCGAEGTYKIALSGRSNLESSVKVYLKDKFANKIINLSTDSCYIFQHNVLSDINRFTVLLNPSDDIINNITPDSYYSVFAKGNEITVRKNTSKDINGKIIVTNMLGQDVLSNDLSNSNSSVFRITAPSGYYIVKIVSDYNSLNFKILITN